MAPRFAQCRDSRHQNFRHLARLKVQRLAPGVNVRCDQADLKAGLYHGPRLDRRRLLSPRHAPCISLARSRR